jgi:hypothetical protein
MIPVRGQPGQTAFETLQNKQRKIDWNVWLKLHQEQKALSSNSSPTKKQKLKKRKEINSSLEPPKNTALILDLCPLER